MTTIVDALGPSVGMRQARAAHVFVAADDTASTALQRVGERLDSEPALADLGARLRALRLAEPDGYNSLWPPYAHDPDPNQAVAEAMLRAWSEVGAQGESAEAVVAVIGEAPRRRDSTDLAPGDHARSDLLETARRVRQDLTAPGRFVVIAVCSRPVDDIDLEALCRIDGLSISPVLLDAFTGGPLPTSLVPDAVAECLVLAASHGVTHVLGTEWEPRNPQPGVLLVALDSIEVPNAPEASYVAASLRRHWVGQIMASDPRPRADGAPAPSDVLTASLSAVEKAAQERRSRLAAAMATPLRQAAAEAASRFDPRVLYGLRPPLQLDVVTSANDWVATELTTRLRSRAESSFDERASISAVVREHALTLIGGYEDGPALADTFLQDAEAALLEDAARDRERHLGRSETRPEPAIHFDPNELAALSPAPPCASLRSLLGWLVSATLGAFVVLSSWPRASPDLLESLVALVWTGTAFWQAVQVVRFVSALRLASLRPILRVQRALQVWETWFTTCDVPLRLAREVRDVRHEILAFRRRLRRLHAYLAEEESAMADHLVGHAFPRRMMRRREELDALATRAAEHYGTDWFLRALSAQGVSPGPAAIGEMLVALLESAVLPPRGRRGPLAHVYAQAEMAAQQLLRTDGRQTLDSRMRDPEATLRAMRTRAQPTGVAMVSERLFVDESSQLAAVAAAARMEVVGRTDRSRATIAVVSWRPVRDS